MFDPFPLPIRLFILLNHPRKHLDGQRVDVKYTRYGLLCSHEQLHELR